MDLQAFLILADSVALETGVWNCVSLIVTDNPASCQKMAVQTKSGLSLNGEILS